MVTSLTVAPMRSGLHYYLEQQFNSFHNFPIETDLDNLNADVAILGIPFGDPYSMGEASNDQAFAPTHIRRHCGRALRGLDRYDFDIGGTLLDGRDIKVVDCGDVIGVAKDVAGNHARSEAAVKKILAAGALPIILGGDHAIPIPVFRAYEGRGPITLIQVDAHIDWRDIFHGVRDGVDPTIMPAVAGPAPGGVNYPQMRTLIQGLVNKGKVVGMDVVEITPSRDLNGITAVTAGRFICNLIGTAVRAGYFENK